MQIDLYSVTQDSVARTHLVFWIAVITTAVVAAFAVWRFRARGLWIAAIGAVVIPPLSSVVVGGGELPTSLNYVSDVLVPLAATIGLVSAMLGALAGWLAGRVTARRSR
ncbi:MAG: hypothetical protein ACM3ZV_13575 [Bacillota bacterium]